MEFRNFARMIILPMLVCCFFLTSNAQVEKKEQTPEKQESKTKTVTEDGKTIIKKTDVDKNETTTKVKVKEGDTNTKTVVKQEADGDYKTKEKVEVETPQGDMKIEQKTKVDGNETKQKTTLEGEDGSKLKKVTKTEEDDGLIKKETKVEVNGETEKYKTTEVTTRQLTNNPYTWRESTDTWYTPKSYNYRYSGNTVSSDQTATRNPADRGPVYLAACKDTRDPSLCTENFMKAKFLNIYQPGLSFPSGYSGVEYVSFDVDANGKIVGYHQVARQPVVCEPCSQAAVNHVSSLSHWQAATQNGRPVQSTVVIPVYFDTTMMGKDN